MLRILPTIRMAGECFKGYVAFKRDAESTIVIPDCVHDAQWSRVLLSKPAAPGNIENGIVLVPVEIVQLPTVVSWTEEIIAPEEDSSSVHDTPPALHMKT